MAAGRKEDFKQATVYLYNIVFGFTKGFYCSALYFSSSLPF